MKKAHLKNEEKARRRCECGRIVGSKRVERYCDLRLVLLEATKILEILVAANERLGFAHGSSAER